MGDPRKAQCVAGLVARRLLDAIEGNLENDGRLDGEHWAVAARRRRLKVLGETRDLRVGEAGVGLADVHEFIVTADREGDVGEDRAALAVAVLRGSDDAVERSQRLL